MSDYIRVACTLLHANSGKKIKSNIGAALGVKHDKGVWLAVAMLTPRQANPQLSEQDACSLGLTAERGLRRGGGGEQNTADRPSRKKK